jgi:uncharacterized protein YxeA
MKKILAGLFVFALVVLIAAPVAAEQTWKDVSVVDQMCSGKDKVMSAPEKHTKECMVKCEKSGYGVYMGEGKDKKFVKFDAAGNKLTVEALKASKKTDGMKATVVGEMADRVIKVKSIAFAE